MKKKVSQWLATIKRGLRCLKSSSCWKQMARRVKEAGRASLLFGGFFVLVLHFLLSKGVEGLRRLPGVGRVMRRVESVWERVAGRWMRKVVARLDELGESEVRRSYLIQLAYKNMMLKRARSLITVAGMGVGIGAIVFLVSLGYGLERLVITRVARLEELKMADVSPGESTVLRLNEEAMEKIRQIDKVEEVIPVISVVGRINFHDAVADVLAYGVPRSYLDLAQIKTVEGEVFESNELALGGVGEGAVRGVTRAEYRTKWIGAVHFNVEPEKAVLVWEECEPDSKVLGYTRRVEGGFWGEEWWGGSYYSEGGEGMAGYDEERDEFLGEWIRTKVPLFQKTADGDLLPLLDAMGRPRWEWGWLMKKGVQVLERDLSGLVLGEATEATAAADSSEEATAAAELLAELEATEAADLVFDEVVVSTDSAGMEWIEFKATDSAKLAVTQVEFKEPPLGEALVSTGMLRLFGLPADKAVGERFKVSFIIVKSLMPEVESKVMSEEVEYEIRGVIEDETGSYFYVPFVDLRRLGVRNFSQLRVIVKNKGDLPAARKEIETLGFRTSSTVDTVSQIERLFKNVRFLLALLGLIALGVAVLGMFNTLTVSLLERTREIGGLKAMGMLSGEIRDLLLAEAMIMGLSGGFGGLFFGFAAGKLLSVMVSVLAVAKGQGFLNLTYIPAFFVLFILVSSFVVGVLTGLYPAKRATRISALNALRYE